MKAWLLMHIPTGKPVHITKCHIEGAIIFYDEDEAKIWYESQSKKEQANSYLKEIEI